ncbi:MAG: YbaK/EbsC family protein [Proteobacteria bacterium]|nr:YbaK/EbsC family protein [Pseudomonadota bacterium]MBI3499234.1 YbaK/EbsC family protein [Pseudomonadota bacterium]
MVGALKPAAQRVQDLLAGRGFSNTVVELPDSTRSAAEAAAAMGCRVEEIVKSLIFRAKPSNRAVLVIASGGNRVDEAKVASVIGQAIGKADAAFVRERTGFAIGGVAPIGHSEPPITVIDRDLLALTRLYAAAGTPNAVFPLTPDELVRMTDGRVADVRLEKA